MMNNQMMSKLRQLPILIQERSVIAAKASFLTALVLLLLTTGCNPGAYTGGGWVHSSVDQNQKATFGFSVIADDTDDDGLADTAKGQFQYVDRPADVAIHGKITGAGHINFVLTDIGIGGEGRQGRSELIFFVEGDYTPIPRSLGPGGTFEAFLVDWGEPGSNERDVLCIELSGGVHDGYSNLQFVRGGNMKFHPRD